MKKATTLFSLFIVFQCWGQNFTADDYIRTYKDAAIENMKLKKIPASITLAQGILESSNGNSELAISANNHFGIKCHTTWTGKTYTKDDDAPNECFRKYNNVLESYEDHADFLSSRERYKSLFSLEITDYQGWAKGLKAAGYATNPTYAEQLIGLIEKYKLYEFDMPFQTIAQKPYNTIEAPATAKTNQQGTGMVFFINGLRAIKVSKGQTKNGIATDFGLKASQIESYNELGTDDELYENQLIFLEPKRSTAEEGFDFHLVKPGDTFYSIAQSYGITVRSLLSKNNMDLGSLLKSGDKLHLRKNKS